VIAAVEEEEEESPFEPARFTSRLVKEEHILSLLGCSAATWSACYVKIRDEGNHRTWHELCDNKGPTLTIIQSSDNWVFGGYTSLNWDMQSGYGEDTKAFLFTDKGTSLGAGIYKPAEYEYTRLPVSRIKLVGAPTDGAGRAIYRSGASGPRWGTGYDLYVGPDMNSGWTSTADYGLPGQWSCRPTPSGCLDGGLAGTWGSWGILDLETLVVSGCVPLEGENPNDIQAVNSGNPVSISVAVLVVSALVNAQILWQSV
jgi:hypothetical protein